MHRIAGDCEYHFHLRYYKTSLCFFELNSHGFCTKYGRNCAFAHGFGDLRDPVKCDMEMQGKMTANLTRKAEKAATNFASSWGAQSQLFGEASGYDSSVSV